MPIVFNRAQYRRMLLEERKRRSALPKDQRRLKAKLVDQLLAGEAPPKEEAVKPVVIRRANRGES